MGHPMTKRRAVRVVVVDERERVLLLWHEAPHDQPHWAPPGGGIEKEEGAEEAAMRELAEEAGLTGVELGRPVWRWCHEFSFAGLPVRQEELIYVVRARHYELGTLTADQAADGIVDRRWWFLSDLAACRDEVWPPGLEALLPPVLAGTVPATWPLSI